MKKLIGTLIATLPCLAGFGQGQVNFINVAPGAGVNAPVYDCLNNVKLAGSTYQAGLYASTTSTSLVYVGNSAPFLTGGGAGYFNGGTITLPGIPGGATAWLQVVVWDATLKGTTTGATWAQALATDPTGANGVWGTSEPFSVVTGDPTTSPPGVPTPLVGLRSFCLGGCLGPYFHGITAVPQSQTVYAGAPVTFSVVVEACPPPAYQWYFNGVPILGATWRSYSISHVRPANAGTYRVIVDAPYWNFHSGAEATLTVLAPPTITSMPPSQTAETGSAADFAVRFDGFPTPDCRWFFDGKPLPAETNFLLRLANVQPAQSGPYTVVVTNIAGAVTSPPALLSVIAPVERRLVPTLTLMGQPGTWLNLDFAEALGVSVNWQPLERVALTNTSQFYFDSSTPLPVQRFYRGWQAGMLEPAPLLDLHMVPGVILTGAVGSRVRVDAINVFGPTDAWFTLDTITLTNTTQLYLDTSSIYQPRRLWRVIPQ